MGFLHNILIAYLAFLFPIAVYCLVLAQLNRRPAPTMVTGVWDCIGMLLAGSGFLLVSGPILINALFLHNVKYPFGDARNEIVPLWAIVEKWATIWVSYYVFVLAGAVTLIWLRRDVTVVYNVDPDLFEQLLGRTVERLGLTQVRHGRRIQLAPELAARETHVLSGPPKLAAANPHGELRVDSFPAMSNVTLHWDVNTPALRTEIEDEARRNLDECRTLDNPAGTWFLSVGTFLFGLVFLVIVFVLLMMYLPPRRW